MKEVVRFVSSLSSLDKLRLHYERWNARRGATFNALSATAKGSVEKVVRVLGQKCNQHRVERDKCQRSQSARARASSESARKDVRTHLVVPRDVESCVGRARGEVARHTCSRAFASRLSFLNDICRI